MQSEIRNTKINIITGRYKASSANSIPNDIEEWYNCPKCDLKPLTWEFNNGRSTACGCDFSIFAESIMSVVTANNGSALNYETSALKVN